MHYLDSCTLVCLQPLLKPSEARTPLKGSVAGTPQRLQPCAGGDELVLKMHSKQGTLLKERLFAKVCQHASQNLAYYLCIFACLVWLFRCVCYKVLHALLTIDRENAVIVYETWYCSSRATVGSVLETHQKMQEEIAEDMVRMARSLRSNSLLVRDIIQKDSKVIIYIQLCCACNPIVAGCGLHNLSSGFQVLTKTNELADDNIEGIDRNVAKLKQNNSQCSWWIWIMLAVVFVVFFAMVLFIRVMPKPH